MSDKNYCEHCDSSKMLQDRRRAEQSLARAIAYLGSGEIVNSIALAEESVITLVRIKKRHEKIQEMKEKKE